MNVARMALYRAESFGAMEEYTLGLRVSEKQEIPLDDMFVSHTKPRHSESDNCNGPKSFWLI